jgi:hypothetical protein
MKVTVNNDSYSIDLIQSANPAEDAVHALAAIIEEGSASTACER